jgi:hypothetical protein
MVTKYSWVRPHEQQRKKLYIVQTLEEIRKQELDHLHTALHTTMFNYAVISMLVDVPFITTTLVHELQACIH